MLFLLRRADKFDLTRRKAFLSGFLLCADVLFLPEFLQKGLIWAWLFLTCGLISLSVLRQRWRSDWSFAQPGAVCTVLDTRATDDPPGDVQSQGNTEEDMGNTVEDLGNTGEDLGNTEENMGDIQDVSVLAEGRDALLPPKVTNLEQLLDLGFAAKNEGRYGLAAEWFEKALDLNPAPDLAVSLLIDVFWLRQIAADRENAAQQFRALWLDHQSLVPPGSQFRRRILDWMDKQSFAAGNYIK